MTKNNKLSILWFLLGFAIFVFTRMSNIVPTIPVAILIAPVFILRFNRSQPAARGNILTLLGFIVSINVGLWGLFTMEDGFFSLVFNVLRSSLLAVLYFLPYMMPRLIYPRFKDKGISSALIFPVITAAVDMIRDREFFGHLTNRSTLREQDLSLPQLIDDLLCAVSLSWHLCLPPLFTSAEIHYNAGSVWGGAGHI